jgi:iron complex outermembrane recepter protein
MTRNKLALSLAGLLLAPIAGTAFAQSAPAQDQSQQPAASQSNTKQLQTITVTGSALPRVDTETPSPVTVISSQQIARSGFTTISDVVRSISADNSGSIPNSFTNGFAAGSSGVALRGLTVNSTLVLIDGQRSASYPLSDDGERSFTDLNTIPLAAVERIEVLKDGASSLYGADAIAGVVNIILKPGFQGVEGTADIGNSQKGGGFTKKATFMAGAGDLNTDHYNAYFSVQYEQDNPIYARDRGFPNNTSNLTSIGGQNNNAGNPAVPTGSVYGTVAPATLGVPGDLLTGKAVGPFQPLSPCGSNTQSVTVAPTAQSPGGTYCSQNMLGQYGELQAKMQQGGLYGRMTVKINDTTKAYISASYMESKTWTIGQPAQINVGSPVNTNAIALPPILTSGPNAGQLNPNDPYAASGQYALLNYAFGDIPAGTNYDNHNARIVGDVSGTFGDWNYDTAVVLNHDWLNVQQFGFINYDQLISDINSGAYSFINPKSNSAAVLTALSPSYAKTSTSDLDSISFNANRELWDLPGGAAGLAVGAQVRHEAQNDPTLNPNNSYQGLGVATTKGSRDVSSAYAEFDMPLLDSLEVDASGRFDHYSDFGNNFSPKIGFKWKPLDWVAVRGTYSKGFRAPSFAENGSSESEGFVNYGGTQLPASFVAAHNNSPYVTLPYSLAEFTQANPNIKPEKARSFTFGFVLQPTSWLNASVDYYNIKKTNVITQADTASALSNYFAGLPQAPGVTVIADQPDPAAPNALPRPIEVIGEYINANSLKTDGVDVDLQAHWDFSNGIHYISEVQGTQIFNWTMVLPGGVVESFAGTHGPDNLSSGAGTPRFRGSWANTVEYGPVTVTGTLYHTSGMWNYAEDVGGGPGNCLTVIPLSCRIGSFTDFDLTGSYAINEHISLTASIMNVFDRKAPLDPASYAGGVGGANYNPTWAQDGVVGRFWNLGVKVKF